MEKTRISTFLKQLRKTSGLSANDVVKKLQDHGIDISPKTLYGYESGISMLNADVFVSLCRIYKCDNPMDLFGTLALSASEHSLIENYRNLDDFGRKTVDISLSREAERIAQLQAKQEHIDALESEQQKVSKIIQSIRIYTYFGRIACAGSGFYFDDIPTETIEAPDMGGDFIIGVNGDSMEPDYHDGDKLYVKKTEHISHGDVGIFTIGNECFLKEYGEEGLISRNRDYGDIPGTEDVRLIGKVIGKVEEDI